jgi:uncharacterized protein (TIGR03437 family)
MFRSCLVLVVLFFVASVAWTQPVVAPQKTLTPLAQARWKSAALHPSFNFEANEGQADSRVKFLSRGCGYEVFLTSEGALLAPGSGKSMFGLRLVGADPRARIDGLDPLPGVSNYLIGSDPSKWTTGVARYAKVRYEQIYPGINLVYYGSQHELEHDFIVAPGADPSRIRMRFEGARKIRRNTDGDLLLDTSAGQVRQAKPAVYQEQAGGRRQIVGRYMLHHGQEVSFEVGPYDHSKPLVIDPVTYYTYFSSYLGGSGDDQPFSIVVDTQGNAYVTGTTTSVDFPTKGPEQPASAGKTDVFITKLDGTYGTILYSTYLGGSDDDSGNEIRVDSAGNAYVTGTTHSTDFPVTQGAFQTKLGGVSDAFVAKLNAAGNALAYSTYLGGSDGELGNGLDLDQQGNAYVVGDTFSADFPATQTSFGNAPHGGLDGFVAKVNPTGTALVYAGYLGGHGTDAITAIAVNSFREAYVVGWTDSTNLPTTPQGSRWPNLTGAVDGFMAKVSPRGDYLGYISYYGGSLDDILTSVSVDSRDAATIYVGGLTESPDFPTPDGARVTVAVGEARPLVARFKIPAGVIETLLRGEAAPAATARIDDYDWIWLFTLEDDVNYDQLMKKVEQETKDLEQKKMEIETLIKNLENTREKIGDLAKDLIYGTAKNAYEIADAVQHLLTNTSPEKLSAEGLRLSSTGPAIEQAAPQQPGLFLLNADAGSVDDAPQFPAGTAGAFTSINGVAAGPSGSIYLLARTNDATLPVGPLGSKPAGGPSDAYVIKFSTTAPPPPPPLITGVVNGASFTAGAPVAPGSIISLFGTLLASSTANAASTPLPSNLGNTSVSIGGKAAPLFFVSSTQINAQVPWETPTGTATAIVTSNGTPSAAFQFTVAAANPGIFVFGANRAVVQNQDYSINNAGNPAAPGSDITVYLTGGGALDNPVATGAVNPASPLSHVTASYSATVGGQPASVLFLGLSPGFVGLFQANLQVPQLISGDYPLMITIGGVQSNAPLISVSGGQ